jgi:hypothetical protein
VPYILLAVALYLPSRVRCVLGAWALGWVDGLFRLYKLDGARLIVHSDALPFARAFVLQARHRGMKTICVQHGIFHANCGMEKFDGYLCDSNVVRSVEDGALISSCNTATELIVEPDFFLTPFERFHSNNKSPLITLVGEGWHSIDDVFSNKYIARLKQFEVELFSLGFNVQFRPHPSERSFVNKFGFKKIDMTDIAISMGRTDMYLGFSSTLLIEAAAAGLVAAQIKVDGAFNPAMNRAGLNIWLVESAQDIARLLENSRNKNYLNNDLLDRKNKAIDRVCKTIN